MKFASYLHCSVVLAVAFIALNFTSTAQAQIIVYSININSTPLSTAISGIMDTGWAFTSTGTGTIDEIASNFGPNGNNTRTVGIELFNRVPSAGGTLLATGSIVDPPADTLTYGLLNTPVFLTAGTSYFVAFTNVQNLGNNVTAFPTDPPVGQYVDFSGSSIFPLGPYPGAPGGNPILSFARAVPEPSTWALLLGGLGALAFLRRRKLNV